MNKLISSIIVASVLFVSAIENPAHADTLDNEVIKAERSVANATKKLEAARKCAADKPVCIAARKEKASKRLAAAQKQFDAIASIETAPAN